MRSQTGLQRLEALENDQSLRQPDWFGENEVPLDDAAFIKMRELLASLPKPLANSAQVVPLSNGNLQVEWHQKGCDVEVEVEARSDIDEIQADIVRRMRSKTK